MTGELKILPYSPDRAGEVAGLLNAALGAKTVGVRDADYWRWKHELNPFGPSFILLAEIDGRLVGARAFMRWQFEWQGQPVDVAKPVDSVTHPDFQRRGIFSKLTTAACDLAAEAGTQMLCNTPNAKSKPGYLKLGWHVVGELPVRGKLQRPFSACLKAAKAKLVGEGPVERLSFFRQAPLTADDVMRDVRLEALLQDRAREADRLDTARSLPFLRWRYTLHPHIDYFAETLERDGQLDGVLFYRTNVRRGSREIMIDDLLVRSDAAAESVPSLLKQLDRTTDSEYWVVHQSTGSPQHEGLAKAGFKTVPGKRITLAARSLQTQFDVPTIDRWSLCLGDIEGL